jgi:hypothetical protein
MRSISGMMNGIGKQKKSKINLSEYHFVHHKSHMDNHGIETDPPR